MNYLAHLLLSGNDADLQMGNFIADGVRGAKILLYPERVQQGIKLHRMIDAFTDKHPVVAETKERLRPKFRKYAGVVADIFYDHFLATGFSSFSTVPLAEFAACTYQHLQANPHLLPERVQHFLPYMIKHNWLVSYAQVEGIARALKGLSTRAAFASGMEHAGEELQLNYAFYQQEFDLFFPELQLFVNQEITLLNSNS